LTSFRQIGGPTGAVDEVPPGFINAWGLRYAMDF
jgi:hypothetical protein